jgi:hypothetical protein
MSITDSLKIVADYLAQFYKDEDDDIQATLQAVRAASKDREYRWEVAKAFKAVMDADLGKGVLTQLVIDNAKRDVFSDEEAMQFLRSVYEDNYLYDADDMDEVREDHERMMKELGLWHPDGDTGGSQN